MKTLTAYLTAAGITGDAVPAATAALQAALNDAQSEVSAAQGQIQTEIRENQQARALAAAFRKVADKAGVDLSPLADTGISAERRRELSDSAGQQVLEFVSAASEQASSAAHILRDAGFDLDAYQKAGKDKRETLAREFVVGISGTKAKLREVERDQALADLKVDPKKAGRILGDVVLTKGKATVTGVDGKPVEVDTWGVQNADGTFTTAEKLIADAGWTLAELAPAQQQQGGNTQQQAGGWSLNGGQSASTSGSGGGMLDFLTAKPEGK